MSQRVIALSFLPQNDAIFLRMLACSQDFTSYGSGERKNQTVVASLQLRLDNIQRRVCNVYWEHENALLDQKDQTISQLHNDRLTILGKMAASMVHELRNPLTAIEGFIQLIRSEMNSKTFNLHKVNGFLDIIQAEFPPGLG